MEQPHSIIRICVIAMVSFVALANGNPTVNGNDFEKFQFGSDPSNELPYIQLFEPGTSFEEVFSNSTSSGLVIQMKNENSTHHMCIFGQVNYVLGHTGHFTYNGTFAVPIPANSTAKFGNLAFRGAAAHNGRAHARYGCDDQCGNCPGIEKSAMNTITNDPNGTKHGQALSPAVHSLVEWTWSTVSEAIKDGILWVNLSNVDGQTVNMNLTVPDTECSPRACMVSEKRLKDLCPPKNYWEHDGVSGCRSDCKLTNSDYHCCEGVYNVRGSCEATSSFLADICVDSYPHPHDDQGHVDRCTGAKVVNIGFGGQALEGIQTLDDTQAFEDGQVLGN